jgi:hypothetical protein
VPTFESDSPFEFVDLEKGQVRCINVAARDRVSQHYILETKAYMIGVAKNKQAVA